MSEVKNFRIVGEIVKPNLKTSFKREVRGLKPEDALEEVYKEIGSRHKVRRFQIRVLKVEEIKPEEIEDPIVRKLALGEALK